MTGNSQVRFLLEDEGGERFQAQERGKETHVGRRDERRGGWDLALAWSLKRQRARATAEDGRRDKARRSAIGSRLDADEERSAGRGSWRTVGKEEWKPVEGPDLAQGRLTTGTEMLGFAEARQVGVDDGGDRTFVAEVDLDLAQVLALLEQVSCVRMAQRMDMRGPRFRGSDALTRVSFGESIRVGRRRKISELRE